MVAFDSGRRRLLAAATASAAALALPLLPGPARAEPADAGAAVLIDWHRLVLELVRHTPTCSPPVAARCFALLGIAAWEVAAGLRGGTSLAGQVTALTLPPAPLARLDLAAALHGALAQGVPALFGNTGPTGQRAMAAMARVQLERVSAGLAPADCAAAVQHGAAVMAHVLDWARDDGGAVVENLGFPLRHTLGGKPASWVPTGPVQLQQLPLLPEWGGNRPMVLPAASACGVADPPAYDETPGSAFYQEALEVYEAVRGLDDERRLIARFWSDDPMLSSTPPGHWISILLDLAGDEGLSAERTADALARLGIAVNDAFIACWAAKYRHDLLRPVTYIRRVIDKSWEPLLITPPFPEYPSGHSAQSGAAAMVLAAIFGEDFAFDDRTHAAEGMKPRHFASFAAAAQDAALSRLYGGIHFRAAIEQGLKQGDCVGAHVLPLRTL